MSLEINFVMLDLVIIMNVLFLFIVMLLGNCSFCIRIVVFLLIGLYLKNLFVLFSFSLDRKNCLYG